MDGSINMKFSWCFKSAGPTYTFEKLELDNEKPVGRRPLIITSFATVSSLFIRFSPLFHEDHLMLPQSAKA